MSPPCSPESVLSSSSNVRICVPPYVHPEMAIDGAPPGAAKAAAFWSTRRPTSWTCGNGSAACLSRYTPRWRSVSDATSRSRTRSLLSSTMAGEPPASLSQQLMISSERTVRDFGRLLRLGGARVRIELGHTQHVAVLENFVANILDGTPLIAPGSEGINEVQLADATYLSSWTRCRGPAGLRR